MTEQQPESNPSKFLLIGNGPYLNRGCEAIVRGTVRILRNAFEDAVTVRAGVMSAESEVADQNRRESDAAISSFSIGGTGLRGSLKWWKSQANKRLGTDFQPHLQDLSGQVDGMLAALEIGGDNYTLDYGIPKQFMAMDAYLLSKGIPVILWGASVGRFDAKPQFAEKIFEHLRTLRAVFVRESESLDYLHANGVKDNVHLTADPAFLMEPEKPAELDPSLIPHGETIGINLSSLVGRYRGTSSVRDPDDWLHECVRLVESLDSFGRPILLIPHVASSYLPNCDFTFLRRVHDLVGPNMKSKLGVLPDHLNAAELKWIISRCAVFAGARTHSTIAALSTTVPTLSIGYSLKARGLNKDIYGSIDHCIDVSDLSPSSFLDRMRILIDQESPIRASLAEQIPDFKTRAMQSGDILREIVGKKR